MGMLQLLLARYHMRKLPEEAFEPLYTVGKWLEANGEAVYGQVDKSSAANWWVRGSTRKKNVVYIWNWIWPDDGEFTVGGYRTKLVSAKLLDGTELPFEQDEYRLTVRGLPQNSPDGICNVGIVKLEFEKEPEFLMGTRYPQLHGGTQVLW